MSETPDQSVTPAQTYGAVDLSQTASAAGTESAPQTAGAQPLVIDVTEATFEQVMATSMTVPVVVDLWATWCAPCKQLGPVLEELVRSYEGRLQLAKIDIDENPQIAQAFQVQSVPTVIALVGGRPIPLFQGAQPKAQVRQIFDQLLAAAQEMGVAGRLEVGEDAAAPATPEEQAIEAAIEAGEYDTAIGLLKKAATNNPAKKAEYVTQLAQVELQARLASATDDSDPLSVADQFVAHGNEAAAYRVLLDVIASATDDERESARARLVELLRVGADAEAVKTARAALSRLLF